MSEKIGYAKTREHRVFRVIADQLYQGEPCIVGGRYYPWLKSPKNEPLQLDILLPTIPLAIEIQGQQHFEYIKEFFSTRESWEYYKECDQIKQETCAKYKIPLLIIKPTDDISAEALMKRIKILLGR